MWSKGNLILTEIKKPKHYIYRLFRKNYFKIYMFDHIKATEKITYSTSLRSIEVTNTKACNYFLTSSINKPKLSEIKKIKSCSKEKHQKYEPLN